MGNQCHDDYFDVIPVYTIRDTTFNQIAWTQYRLGGLYIHGFIRESSRTRPFDAIR